MFSMDAIGTPSPLALNCGDGSVTEQRIDLGK
jgi:hypothetical protein